MSDKPQRIQLSRRPGFRLKEVSHALNGLAAVSCVRPAKHGNYAGSTKRAFIEDLAGMSNADKTFYLDRVREDLRGKNLACWCRLDAACHVDVLLELANAPQPPASAIPADNLTYDDTP